MKLVAAADVALSLTANHYLGPSRRGWALVSEEGEMVFANPSSRRLPQQLWIELVRWRLTGVPNAGSQQWSKAVRWLKENRDEVTTVVSYSDPSVGHTGALYRASNWWWAPTWQRLRPPPSGNGTWTTGGKVEAVKDRWVFPLSSDLSRIEILVVKDTAVLKKMPWARYSEPGGADYKAWKAYQSAARG